MLRLRFYCLLEAGHFRRVEGALSAFAHVHAVRKASDLEATANGIHATGVIVDPLCLPLGSASETTIGAYAQSNSRKLVLYCRRSLKAVELGVSLQSRYGGTLLLEGTEYSAFPGLCRRMQREQIISGLIARLCAISPKMPVQLISAMETLFVNSGRIGTVEDLAVLVGMARRTFDRQLKFAGLCCGKTLLDIALVVHLYEQLRHYKVDVIASNLEMSAKTLRQKARRVAGRSPSELRKLSAEE